MATKFGRVERERLVALRKRLAELEHRRDYHNGVGDHTPELAGWIRDVQLDISTLELKARVARTPRRAAPVRPVAGSEGRRISADDARRLVAAARPGKSEKARLDR